MEKIQNETLTATSILEELKLKLQNETSQKTKV